VVKYYNRVVHQTQVHVQRVALIIGIHLEMLVTKIINVGNADL